MKLKLSKAYKCASSSEKDRINISRSYGRLQSEIRYRRIPDQTYRDSPGAIDELIDSLRQELSEERECRRGLKHLNRERLAESLTEIHRLQAENSDLLQRLTRLEVSSPLLLTQSSMVQIFRPAGTDRGVQFHGNENVSSVQTWTGRDNTENLKPVINVHRRAQLRNPITATHFYSIWSMFLPKPLLRSE